ncbi:GerW family sporulation protein [Ectobacillus sp. sgz5001026]|uniref:GerW family sporulation protein n=1 Tax=Ectobacillus sp. sgz5001026 TaxID=3242473 RepID=UPI0036D3CFAC
MQHPIEDLMKTTMHNLKAMVDVNTIIGKPVSTQDGSVILTVSKVSFGFGAGGSDFQGEGSLSLKRPRNKFHPNVEKTLENETEYPFGGGSGAGVSISPVAFLVVGEKGVRVMHLQSSTHLIEKVMETAPKTIQSIQKVRNASSTAHNG